MIKKGEKGKNINDKLLLNEIMSDFSIEVIAYLSFSNSLVTRMIDVQDKKIEQEQKLQKAADESNQLRQQIIELLVQLTQGPTGTGTTPGSVNPYLQTIMKQASKDIKDGTSLPLPSIPESVKHALAERILIFQAKTKGAQLGKKE